MHHALNLRLVEIQSPLSGAIPVRNILLPNIIILVQLVFTGVISGNFHLCTEPFSFLLCSHCWWPPHPSHWHLHETISRERTLPRPIPRLSSAHPDKGSQSHWPFSYFSFIFFLEQALSIFKVISLSLSLESNSSNQCPCTYSQGDPSCLCSWNILGA